MPPFTDRRLNPRTELNDPLGVTCIDSATYDPFQADIRNISDEGAYLETSRELDPDDSFVIVVNPLQIVPESVMDILLREHEGTVIWSQPLLRDGKQLYGAGIELFNTSMAV